MEGTRNMKIRLAKNYSTYTVGTVVDCEEETAQRLIRDGLAVREQQMDLIETASVEHDVERADATPRRTRRAVPKPEDGQ
jgi:hypothetical protein